MTLSIRKLYKEFDGINVLSDINFEINENEIVGLLGPNGAGKTSLMNIISGNINASTGGVFLNDNNSIFRTGEAKENIGYLAEHNPLYNEMYVAEFLRFCASCYKKQISDIRIEDLIHDGQLSEVRNSLIGTLSKGYKQRLGLVQAILHNPQILLLDEATSGLDPVQQSEMKSNILKINKGKIILFSSHDLNEIYEICSRVIILNKGELIRDIKLSTLKSNIKELKDIYFTLTSAD